MITKAALIDLAERAGWTFLQVGAGTLLLSGITTMTALQGAGLAGLTAVLSVVKSFAASQLGDHHSASMVDGPIADAIIGDWEAEGAVYFDEAYFLAALSDEPPYENRG